MEHCFRGKAGGKLRQFSLVGTILENRSVGSKNKNLHALLYHSSVENKMYLCMFLHALYLDL